MPLASHAHLAPSSAQDVVTLCGDAHVSNLGLFASAERRHLFDLNHFDETWPGPFEWDGVAASEEGSPHVGVVGGGQGRPQVPSRDSVAVLGKLTTLEGGRPQLVSDPPLLVPVRDLAPELAEDLEEWLGRLLGQYRESLQADRQVLLDRSPLVDLARKAVSVGSVGTDSYLLLMLDESGSPSAAGQGRRRVARRGPMPWPPLDNQGCRVVEGQRLMQASSDIMLGWQRTAGVDGAERDYYIRQFRDWKGGFEIEALDDPDPGTAEPGVRMDPRQSPHPLRGPA